MNKLHLIGFILLAVAGLWIGAWVYSLFPKGHWADLPIFMTGAIAFVVGVLGVHETIYPFSQ